MRNIDWTLIMKFNDLALQQALIKYIPESNLWNNNYHASLKTVEQKRVHCTPHSIEINQNKNHYTSKFNRFTNINSEKQWKIRQLKILYCLHYDADFLKKMSK